MKIITLILIIITFSCQEDIYISYENKEEMQLSANKPKQQEVDKNAILIAVVSLNQEAYFFKLFGLWDKIKEYKTNFKEFLKGLSLDGDELKWQVPNNWQEVKENSIRIATIKITDDIEISVTRLPNSDLLSNVNRWLGQLNKDPITNQQLGNYVEIINITDKLKVNFIELK